MMKVDGLTNDEVKSHLQKYRLHTRRTSDGHRQQQSASVWPPPEQYTTSQHSTSQSGSPQGPLRLMTTGSSRDVSATAGDSCDGGEEEEEDGKSASYSWEVQQTGTKAASSS
ncbi:transcription factor HHO6-like [Lolium perenne]